ncbi:MAG: spore germination protein GerW family protein [Acidobacteriota bacterium]
MGSSATIKAVFGEPVYAARRTVIPVAKVAYGFGGGFGTGHGKTESDKGRHGEGGGGGGRVRAFPAGALEITENGTRFIPLPNVQLMAAAFAAGTMLGALLLGGRRKY